MDEQTVGRFPLNLVDLVALMLVDIPPSAYFPSGYGFHPCSSGSCCRLDILSFRGVRISYSDQQFWVEKQMDEGVSFSLGVCDIFRRADSGKLSRRAPPPSQMLRFFVALIQEPWERSWEASKYPTEKTADESPMTFDDR